LIIANCFQNLLLFLPTLIFYLGEDPIKLFFLRFLFFGVKLGHFKVNEFFLYVSNMQAYQPKTEKFFVSEEKTFYRIGYSWTCYFIKLFSNLCVALHLILSFDPLVFLLWPHLYFPSSLRLPLISRDLLPPYIWSSSINFANLRDKSRASSDERLLLLFNIKLNIFEETDRAQSYKSFRRLFRRLTLLSWLS